jgi:hypothetical protein
MRRKAILILCLLLIGVITARLVSARLVQYRLIADSIGGGSGTMHSGDFVVDAAVGHGVTVGLAKDGDFTVGSGIWGGGPITISILSEVYLPLVASNAQ